LIVKLPTMSGLASHYHERLIITKRVKVVEENGGKWRGSERMTLNG